MLQELAEVEREMKSREMNEDMTLGISASNPLRFRPDHFKGLLPDQVDAIKAKQREQMEDARVCPFFCLLIHLLKSLVCFSLQSSLVPSQRQREEEERQRREDERKAAIIGRTLVAHERQAERDRKEQQRQMMEENKRQAEMARSRKKELDREYENAVDPSWWDKWNTTSR
jgi:hypothetical protein